MSPQGKAKSPSAKYLARANALAEAIDLSIGLTATLPVPEQEGMIPHALDCKARALAPEPPFANLRSLAYLEDAFLTYWNEASGEHIERFWQALAERGLPFQRKDVVRAILSRGRISSDIEYQTVSDSLVIQQQLGLLSAAEAERLSHMLGRFEARAAGRRRP